MFDLEIIKHRSPKTRIQIDMQGIGIENPPWIQSNHSIYFAYKKDIISNI